MVNSSPFFIFRLALRAIVFPNSPNTFGFLEYQGVVGVLWFPTLPLYVFSATGNRCAVDLQRNWNARRSAMLLLVFVLFLVYYGVLCELLWSSLIIYIVVIQSREIGTIPSTFGVGWLKISKSCCLAEPEVVHHNNIKSLSELINGSATTGC